MRIKVKLRWEKMSERRGEDSDCEGIQQQKGGGGGHRRGNAGRCGIYMIRET